MSDEYNDYPEMFDDDDTPYEGPAYECSGYFDGSHWVCPLIGSEECDWECPEGGLANLRRTITA